MASPASLSLMEYSDRELLNVVLDHENDEGWVSAPQIVEAIGINHRHALQCVSIRFAWMRRYGVMDRDPKSGLWRLTIEGRQIALGSLTKAQKSAIQGLSKERVMEATRLLTGRYGQVGETASTMMRRAWQNGTGRR